MKSNFQIGHLKIGQCRYSFVSIHVYINVHIDNSANTRHSFSKMIAAVYSDLTSLTL